MPDIELRQVGRRFGAQTALSGVTTRLSGGSTTTVFGPNGAGKSTLLRILSGTLRPTEGEMFRGDSPLDTRDAQWRARIGVLSHQTHLYDPLTARENLDFFAALQGVPETGSRIGAALDDVGLADRADEMVSGFSRGMRQRLALARTLMHDPEVVLLDEPFTGLDVHAAAMLERVLRRLRDGRRTVVLVTHALSEGLALADRVVILVRGRLELDSPASDLDRKSFAQRYRDVVEVPA